MHSLSYTVFSQRWHRFERCATHAPTSVGGRVCRGDLRAAAAPAAARSSAARRRGGALADLRRLPVLGARLRKVRLAVEGARLVALEGVHPELALAPAAAEALRVQRDAAAREIARRRRRSSRTRRTCRRRRRRCGAAPPTASAPAAGGGRPAAAPPPATPATSTTSPTRRLRRISADGRLVAEARGVELGAERRLELRRRVPPATLGHDAMMNAIARAFSALMRCVSAKSRMKTQFSRLMIVSEMKSQHRSWRRGTSRLQWACWAGCLCCLSQSDLHTARGRSSQHRHRDLQASVRRVFAWTPAARLDAPQPGPQLLARRRAGAAGRPTAAAAAKLRPGARGLRQAHFLRGRGRHTRLAPAPTLEYAAKYCVLDLDAPESFPACAAGRLADDRLTAAEARALTAALAALMMLALPESAATSRTRSACTTATRRRASSSAASPR